MPETNRDTYLPKRIRDVTDALNHTPRPLHGPVECPNSWFWRPASGLGLFLALFRVFGVWVGGAGRQLFAPPQEPPTIASLTYTRHLLYT
jgi:hypothetical protein